MSDAASAFLRMRKKVLYLSQLERNAIEAELFEPSCLVGGIERPPKGGVSFQTYSGRHER